MALQQVQPGLRAPGAPLLSPRSLPTGPTANHDGESPARSQDGQETDQVDISDPVSVSSFTITAVDYICAVRQELYQVMNDVSG